MTKKFKLNPNNFGFSNSVRNSYKTADPVNDSIKKFDVRTSLNKNLEKSPEINSSNKVFEDTKSQDPIITNFESLELTNKHIIENTKRKKYELNESSDSCSSNHKLKEKNRFSLNKNSIGIDRSRNSNKKSRVEISLSTSKNIKNEKDKITIPHDLVYDDKVNALNSPKENPFKRSTTNYIEFLNSKYDKLIVRNEKTGSTVDLAPMNILLDIF